jgi:hypothetical protein
MLTEVIGFFIIPAALGARRAAPTFSTRKDENAWASGMQNKGRMSQTIKK